MIKIKMVDVKSKFLGGTNLADLAKFSEAVNELGKDRILHVTAHIPQGEGLITRYTILYEDDD